MSRKPNAERGELTLSLEGVDYGLRPSFDAIVEFEEATGKSLTELVLAADSGKLRLPDLGAISCACIRAWARETGQKSLEHVSAKKLGSLIYQEPGGVMLVQKRLALILFQAMTGGFTAEGNPKPGEPKAAKKAAP